MLKNKVKGKTLLNVKAYCIESPRQPRFNDLLKGLRGLSYSWLCFITK